MPRYLGIARQTFRDDTGAHADLERFECPHQHPQAFGSSCVRMELREHYLVHEVRVTADNAAQWHLASQTLAARLACHVILTAT